MAYIDDIDDLIAEVSPYYKKRKKMKDRKDLTIDTIASEQHTLTYNSAESGELYGKIPESRGRIRSGFRRNYYPGTNGWSVCHH